MLAAEQLAFQQAGPKLGSFTLRFIKLAAAKASDNARSAIEDTSSIAYLGELDPGLSADSLGITNAQDLLQVTPTDTAAALTQVNAAVPDSPNRYYESLGNYGRTFARVVPTTSPEAKAQVQEMQALHVSKLYVASDGSQYGRAIAQAVRTDAPASSITVAPSSVRRRRRLLRRGLRGCRRAGVQLGGVGQPGGEAVRPVGARQHGVRGSRCHRPPATSTSRRPGS